MGLDISIFLTYIGAILLVFIFGRLFLWPLKMILKLMISSLIGGLLIFVFNLIGSNPDVIMPLNIFTAFIVGALGLPGAVLLLIFNVI